MSTDTNEKKRSEPPSPSSPALPDAALLGLPTSFGSSKRWQGDNKDSSHWTRGGRGSHGRGRQSSGSGSNTVAVAQTRVRRDHDGDSGGNVGIATNASGIGGMHRSGERGEGEQRSGRGDDTSREYPWYKQNFVQNPWAELERKLGIKSEQL
ncbi:hypothetical protein K440DRAFT_618332 [Wilcoxina mikolae CBS 423.85]|nr:hypothetical protein K440DRAFT_618332 [Wilcoxina mikolae CBS 423.85]